MSAIVRRDGLIACSDPKLSLFAVHRKCQQDVPGSCAELGVAELTYSIPPTTAAPGPSSEPPSDRLAGLQLERVSPAPGVGSNRKFPSPYPGLIHRRFP
jgi:hypothetical protein